MQSELAQEAAWSDAFYFCPFHPDALIEQYRHPNNPDRKPNPGLILEAIKEHPIDVQRAFLIGDQESDLRAAANAGLPALCHRSGDLAAKVRSLVQRK
jgi:D-glycero-D-manno-heptose 1,7-bisphosphate phosphatase